MGCDLLHNGQQSVFEVTVRQGFKYLAVRSDSHASFSSSGLMAWPGP